MPKVRKTCQSVPIKSKVLYISNMSLFFRVTEIVFDSVLIPLTVFKRIKVPRILYLGPLREVIGGGRGLLAEEN